MHPLSDAPTPTTDAVDEPSLYARIAGQTSLLRELLAVFDEQYPEQLAQLRGAADRADAEDLRRAAHRLIGTLACFSATRAVSAARLVERAAAEGDVARASVGVDAIVREVAEASTALTRLAEVGFSPAVTREERLR